MKTAFDYRKEVKQNPVVQFDTIEKLMDEIDAFQQDFDFIVVTDISSDAVQHLMYKGFFDVSCQSKYQCTVRWRGHTKWVAFENETPVFATNQGSWCYYPPTYALGAEKTYSDWRKVHF